MTERQGELVRTAVYVAVVLAYVGALAWVALPDVKARVSRGRQWARYYAWRARWDSLSPWLQEALTVRGRGPA